MQHIHHKSNKTPAVLAVFAGFFLFCFTAYCHNNSGPSCSNRPSVATKYDNSGNLPIITEPFHLFLGCIQQGQ